MKGIRAWLRANGFVIVSERIGPEGILLTVRTPEGREAGIVHGPGLDSLPVLQTLAVLDRAFEVQP